jgi:hypothetical protein
MKPISPPGQRNVSPDRRHVDAPTGIPGVSLADLLYLADVRSAPPAPRRLLVSDDVLLGRMLAAVHSSRRLRRVLACADVTPNFRRRVEATAAEARRRRISSPPRACEQRARPVGAMRRGGGRRYRPGARRRAGTRSGRGSSDPDEPAEGRHLRLAESPASNEQDHRRRTLRVARRPCVSLSRAGRGGGRRS